MKNVPVELIETDIRPRDMRAVRKEVAGCTKRVTDPETGQIGEVIKAEVVVERARDEGSPLHSYFEWDDSVAGHQYRIVQARSLIRTLTVTMPDDEAEAQLPKYVSLKRDRKNKGGGYRETAQVLNNRELLDELERTAKADIEGVLRRYEMLKDLVGRVRRAAGIGAKPAAKKSGKKR